MRKFDSIGVYFLRERKVFCVKLDQDEEREGLLEKIRAEGGVIINGEHHQIDGVESFALAKLRKGMEVGLRVTDNTGSSRG